MRVCKHEFVFKKNDSFYRENGRYNYIYTSIDYYFCNKCLFEKEIKKQATCSNGRQDELPDWARTIKEKVFDF